jgi:oxygen-independent coproporphyrinogen-3 oxidase
MLKDGGVNRISMGVQSLNDDVLMHMRRGYTFDIAEKSFELIKKYFDNAGIDLIIGYPGDQWGQSPRLKRLASWGLKHCSAYSLILEENSALYKLTQMGTVPLKMYSDEEIMDELAFISHFLNDIGLKRYEISNYSIPGYECRHNMATWSGEDYYGLGIGAHGRVGLKRTRNWWGEPHDNLPTLLFPQWGLSPEVETVSEEFDFKERKIFSLRTAKGLDIGDCPHWAQKLDHFVDEGLLKNENLVYRLTERGFEVCDTILAELI